LRLTTEPAKNAQGAVPGVRGGYLRFWPFCLQRLAPQRRPDLYRRVAWRQFGIAGAQGAVVQRNIGLR
jgi:hypothetical protein